MNVTPVVCVALVPVPVTVRLYVPAAAVPEFSVSVEDPAPVREVGLKEALAPAGNPEIERLTVCALPDVIAVEIVDVPEPPAVTLTVLGEAEIEKSFVTTGLMVNVTPVVCVALVPVPVTVRL